MGSADAVNGASFPGLSVGSTGILAAIPRCDPVVGERRHTFSRLRRVYQGYDFYGNRRNPGVTGGLEYSPGRLGLLGLPFSDSHQPISLRSAR